MEKYICKIHLKNFDKGSGAYLNILFELQRNDLSFNFYCRTFRNGHSITISFKRDHLSTFFFLLGETAFCALHIFNILASKLSTTKKKID